MPDCCVNPLQTAMIGRATVEESEIWWDALLIQAGGHREGHQLRKSKRARRHGQWSGPTGSPM